MYLEIENRPYWLVKPTENELRAIEHMPVRKKREDRTGIWLFMVPLGLTLVSYFVVVGMYASTAAPWWTGVIVFAPGSVAIVSALVMVLRGNYKQTLSKMEDNKRAVRLTTNWIARGDIVNTFFQYVLFGGDRKLTSLTKQLEVISVLSPDCIDKILTDPVNAEALQKCSETGYSGVREAWRKALEPRMQGLIDAATLLIEPRSVDESVDAQLEQVETDAAIRRGELEAERFARRVA